LGSASIILISLVSLSLRLELVSHEKSDAEAQAKQIAATLQREMNRYYFANDAQGANRALISRSTIHAVKRLFAVDNEGVVISSINAQDVGKKAANIQNDFTSALQHSATNGQLVPVTRYMPATQSFISYHPLLLSKRNQAKLSGEYGSLFLEFDFKYIAEELNTHLLSHSLLSGALLLALMVVVHIVLRRTVTKPLQRLSDFAQAIANSEQGEVIGVGKGREVATLTRSMQQMAEQLAERARDKEAALAKMRFHASTDSLTGLPNRRNTIESLDRRIDLNRAKQTPFAVLFIDLDNFKRVNDQMGHQVGDQLLCKVADKLASLVRHQDTVGRLGGDEFLLVLSDFDDIPNVGAFARRIVRSIRKITDKDFRECDVSLSIGAAMYPKDGETSTELIKAADIAMYKAKESGKDQSVCYSSEMLERVERDYIIEKELRNSITDESLNIHYQGIFETKTRRLIGFEALARWNSPALGAVEPQEFIPIAERSGFIHQLSDFIICKGMADLAEWNKQSVSPLRLAFNLSPVQLSTPSFAIDIEELMRRHQIAGSQLCFEVTESMMIDSGPESAKVLNGLRSYGCHIAMDDFGTGYSSIRYLRQYPFTMLKIDKSFLEEACESSADESVIEGIIQLSKSMDLQVVAEGVETEEQLRLLQNHNCGYVQGFLLAIPLSHEAIVSNLKESLSIFSNKNKSAND
jgi:diguanylate cyclase (GGDEF)-like protein